MWEHRAHSLSENIKRKRNRWVIITENVEPPDMIIVVSGTVVDTCYQNYISNTPERSILSLGYTYTGRLVAGLTVYHFHYYLQQTKPDPPYLPRDRD